MNKSIRDQIWLWCHETGSYNHNEKFGLVGKTSDFSPSAVAAEMGINNVIMVVFRDAPQPPFHEYAKQFTGMNKVVWSILGDSTSKKNTVASDLANVLDLKQSMPNLCGGIMDDFFDFEGGRKPVETVQEYVDSLHAAGLKLWIVVYERQMDDPALQKFLGLCDVISFWTWRAENFPQMETHLDRLKTSYPEKEISLGCYMWDFGDKKPISRKNMEFQCDMALKKFNEGVVSDIVMLGSPLYGMGIETVQWTRDWIKSL